MKTIHIGNVIKKYIAEKGINKSDLARRINTTPQNVYGILKRKSIDTELLQRIGEELKYNFFEHFMPPTKSPGLTSNKDMEAMKKELEYLKEINALLKKKK